MGKESNLWRYLKRGMGRRWHATRHEDGEPGTPDISYGINGINGWIELKVLDAFPKRYDTVIQFRHLTSWQIRWLQTRGDYGGNCWLFARIENEYLLFKWQDIGLLGKLTKEELLDIAVKVWIQRVNFEELQNILAEA